MSFAILGTAIGLGAAMFALHALVLADMFREIGLGRRGRYRLAALTAGVALLLGWSGALEIPDLARQVRSETGANVYASSDAPRMRHLLR